MSDQPGTSPNAPLELSESLARLAGLVLREESLDAILELVLTLASATLRDIDDVSVSLVGDGQVRTANFTNETVLRLDQVQYSSTVGPCLAAIADGEVRNVGLEADDDRWPEFANAARAAGYSGVLSTPLRVNTDVIGGLNMYSQSSGPFDDAQLHMAELFAKQASVVLANAFDYAGATRLNSELQQALATRETIGQAKGIIMAREGCSSDEAFDVLRRASQRTNRRLREIAADVVASAERKREGPGK